MDGQTDGRRALSNQKSSDERKTLIFLLRCFIEPYDHGKTNDVIVHELEVCNAGEWFTCSFLDHYGLALYFQSQIYIYIYIYIPTLYLTEHFHQVLF